MSAPNEHPEVAKLERIATRHLSRVAAAQRGMSARRIELAKLVAALEETLDQVVPSHQRYRIRRLLELTMLLVFTVAEVIVAESVVQALGLSATSTTLVAVVVGGAATGQAWLVGHEWALAHDPQALAAGRRSWLGAATAWWRTWRCVCTTVCSPSRPASSVPALWLRYWPDPCSPRSPERSCW